MASRKEQKEQRRQERLAHEASAEEQARRRRTYSIVAGAVLVLGVIAAIGFLVAGSGGGSSKGPSSSAPKAQFTGASNPPAQKIGDLFVAAKKAGCELKNPSIAGRTHIPSSKKVVYSTDPPTSGNHDQLAEPDGVYTVYPQPRHIVHALEGGRVEIQYKPSALSKKQLDQLGGLYNEDNLYLLMFPNPTMSYDVAVSAWGHLAGCKKITAGTYDVIRAFIDRYRDQAPEPAATHQPAANQPGWPGQVPPPHKNGNIAGS